MIPAKIRLYTWVDVEDVLLDVQDKGTWPNWLRWASAYWDGLRLGVASGHSQSAFAWLSETFEPRYDTEQMSIILESSETNVRLFPVSVEETDEPSETMPFLPTLARPGILGVSGPVSPPRPLDPTVPPVVAFHSFKGGVGRTVHALALTRALIARGERVLLVDADLEAPGISWLIQSRLPSPPVSFADLLTLAHGEDDAGAPATITLVAERLRQGALVDGAFVLPAFRPADRFFSLEVRPEHLIHGPNPFMLTEMLAHLGKALNVTFVIVDLRAGVSELSTGLLLDPRVYRVLVTTLSDQSVAGTELMLRIIGRLAPSVRDEHPLPAMLFSQIPTQSGGDAILAQTEERLLRAAGPLLGPLDGSPEDVEPTSGAETRADLPRISSRFIDSLQVLGADWQETLERIQRSGLVETVRPLLDWLPERQPVHRATPHKRAATRDRERRQLRDFADKMELAESGANVDFLAIPPLRRLAQDNLRQVPISVVVGAKGAGKTYTFLQIVRRGNWGAFVASSLPPPLDTSLSDALVSPILRPKNLDEGALRLTENVRHQTAKALGFGTPVAVEEVRDHLLDGLSHQDHAGRWRDRWLDATAWSLGFHPNEEGAGRGLPAALAGSKHKVLCLVDGLEDVFQALADNEGAQGALQALLQDVPEWLTLQPSRVLGLLVFARRDMVLCAVRQNSAQLLKRYEPYALKWSATEALRLAFWISVRARILNDATDVQLQEMSEPDLAGALMEVWGRKLGGPTSREATSSEWVIGALSDFAGQIQARDVVRFLRLSADGSLSDTYWADRILTPPAMRRSILQCSQAKIREIGQENETLKGLFAKLLGIGEEQRQIPFRSEQVGLNLDELRLLQDGGVILRDEEHWYMPEIYRQGLGFTLAWKARPRILTLYRRVRPE